MSVPKLEALQEQLEAQSKTLAEVKTRVEGHHELILRVNAFIWAASVFGVAISVVSAWAWKKTEALNTQVTSLSTNVSDLSSKVNSYSATVSNLNYQATTNFSAFLRNATNQLWTEFRSDVLGTKLFHIDHVTVEGGKDKDTKLKVSDYVVAIAGFDAGKGDLQEDDAGPLLYVVPFPKGGTWHIKANIRTHNGTETWTVYYIAILKKLVEGTY